MPKRLVIAIDCDDVLVPSVQTLLDGYNRMFGTHVTAEHFYEPATVATWGTDDDDLAKRQFEQYLRSDDYQPAAPLEDAVNAIRLPAGSYELHVITGRAEDREVETRQLIDGYFKDCFTSIEHTNHFVSSDYDVETRSKGEVCKAIGADIFIDDHIFHGSEVFESGVREVIVFGDYPWNQGELASGMKRCIDWDEVIREVIRLAGR